MLELELIELAVEAVVRSVLRLWLELVRELTDRVSREIELMLDGVWLETERSDWVLIVLSDALEALENEREIEDSLRELLLDPLERVWVESD